MRVQSKAAVTDGLCGLIEIVSSAKIASYSCSSHFEMKVVVTSLM